MLELNKRLQTATLQSEKDQLQQRINYTDNEIDTIVYQLYDLTEDEINIVEGK